MHHAAEDLDGSVTAVNDRIGTQAGCFQRRGECNHFENRSGLKWRDNGKIFATLWDERHANVMMDEGGIRTAVHERPETCSEVWWGKRLAAVRVDLDSAEADVLSELLRDAWETKAPVRSRRG